MLLIGRLYVRQRSKTRRGQMTVMVHHPGAGRGRNPQIWWQARSRLAREGDRQLNRYTIFGGLSVTFASLGLMQTAHWFFGHVLGLPIDHDWLIGFHQSPPRDL